MASADGMNTYPTAMQFETLLYKHNNELYFSLAIYYKVIILVMLCYVMLCYVMLCYVMWVPVTTARRVLGLRMEETASRYEGQLLTY